MVTGSGWSRDPKGTLALRDATSKLIKPAPYTMTGGHQGCCGCYCYNILVVIFRKSDCVHAAITCADIANGFGNDGYLRPTTGATRWPFVAGDTLYVESLFFAPFGGPWPSVPFTVDVYDWKLQSEDATYFTLTRGQAFAKSANECNGGTAGLLAEFARIPDSLRRGCARPTNFDSTQFAFNPP